VTKPSPMKNETLIIGALRSSRNRHPIPGGRAANCCRCKQVLVVSALEYEYIKRDEKHAACPPCYGRIIRLQKD